MCCGAWHADDSTFAVEQANTGEQALTFLFVLGDNRFPCHWEITESTIRKMNMEQNKKWHNLGD